jgi:hypothetical protein
LSTASTSAPSRAKSAERIEGAMRILLAIPELSARFGAREQGEKQTGAPLTCQPSILFFGPHRSTPEFQDR